MTAVVLAAGKASRMHRLKQLLPWGDKTILETVICRLQSSSLSGEIRVVLGAEVDRIKEVLISSPHIDNRGEIIIKKNPEFEKGMFSSVMVGIEGLEPGDSDLEGIMFMLGDMPLIKTSLYDSLLAEFRAENPSILAPRCCGRRGHPVLISTSLLPDLYKMADGAEQPEGGLRELLEERRDEIEYFETEDSSVLEDLDYREEYLQLRPGDSDRGDGCGFRH
ncbi:nucleotidyltransferase family protein [Halarsenatibacter silvermanii]|uniref:nucleotidyltransferase family protein n=1 Tax=Halarsenatibacter silvermanii TaxID=321763 RepID=UPI00117B4F60|nr:nucleotidyltransferase family protein [Halarsenatibacter silvermanii]